MANVRVCLYRMEPNMQTVCETKNINDTEPHTTSNGNK